jgi:hypothetical protein
MVQLLGVIYLTRLSLRQPSLLPTIFVEQYIFTHKLSLIKSEQLDINGYTKNNTQPFIFQGCETFFCPERGEKHKLKAFNSECPENVEMKVIKQLEKQ